MAAHQPIGLQVPESSIPEPPCPYGHDDACEDAVPPRVSVNPYQSEDPHAHALNVDAGHYDHHAHLEDIAALNQQVLARLSRSGNALNDADSESDGPGGGVSYAITFDITGLPWVSDGQTGAELLTVFWLSALQEHNPSLVTALVPDAFSTGSYPRRLAGHPDTDGNIEWHVFN